MKRILLLGAYGQLGRQLVETLGPFGPIVCTIRSPNPALDRKPFRVLDITDADAVRSLVQDVRPQIIVNAAAYTAVDQAEGEPEQTMAVNAHAPALLAEVARQAGALLVHYSTEYVFDGSGETPWRETDQPRPLSVYGRSKLAGDQAIRASGANHLILRTSWTYSPHGRNFIRSILDRAVTDRELGVVDDQVGAPTPARVVAEITAAILRQRLETHGRFPASETLHVCCSGQTSRYLCAQVVVRLARMLNLPLAVEKLLPVSTAEFPAAAQRPLNSRLDCSRLRSWYGLLPPDWAAGLAEELPRIIQALPPRSSGIDSEVAGVSS